MLDKLFEAIDKSVLTEQLQNELTQSFNEAVEVKATEIAAAELEVKTQELNEKYNEKYEEFKASLNEKVETVVEDTVKELVKEVKDSILESVRNKQVETSLEALNLALTAAGVNLINLKEQANKELNSDLAEATRATKKYKDQYDNIFEENLKLKKQIKDLSKIGLTNEAKEGLSLVEAGKFDKMVDLIEFKDPKEFMRRLEIIKESIKKNRVQELLESEEKADKKEIKKDKALDYSYLI